MASLTDYWEAIAPAISPDLISPESLGHLAAVGGHFPSAIASLVGFECRLADPQPQADLFLRVVPENGGRDILAGGEVAAMVLLEAVVRLLPGVAGNDHSLDEESFESGLLEYPHYTRPRVWEDRAIPDVLTSGNHGAVEKWRQEKSEEITKQRRPDLWKAWIEKKEQG